LTLRDHARTTNIGRQPKGAGADRFVSKSELGTSLIQKIHALFGGIAARGEAKE